MYTAQQYDQETGQYYLRARYYNPVVGRFLQEDTYRGDGLNLYAYCANNLVSYYDPSGHGTTENGCGAGGVKKPKDTQAGQVGNKSGTPSGRTFKSSYDIPTNDKGYTKSSLELGKKVHKEYMSDVADDVNKIKEYVLPSGKRVDFIDLENKIVYELKPNNPNQIRKGTKQLAGYLEEIETVFGKGWSSVLDTY